MNEVENRQRKLKPVVPIHPVQTGLAEGTAIVKNKRKLTKTDRKYMFRLLKYAVVTVIVFYLLTKINL